MSQSQQSYYALVVESISVMDPNRTAIVFRDCQVHFEARNQYWLDLYSIDPRQLNPGQTVYVQYKHETTSTQGVATNKSDLIWWGGGNLVADVRMTPPEA